MPVWDINGTSAVSLLIVSIGCECISVALTAVPKIGPKRAAADSISARVADRAGKFSFSRETKSKTLLSAGDASHLWSIQRFNSTVVQKIAPYQFRSAAKIRRAPPSHFSSSK
jgi:hypothetical protein